MSASADCADSVSLWNRQAAGKLFLLAGMMFVFGYALAPLYEKFCAATGFYNILAPAEAAARRVDSERQIRVEFAVTSTPEVSIRPSVNVMEIHPGGTYSVVYEIRNLAERRIFGQAVPAYAPARAGAWFKKIQCFCFDQLTLEKGEVLRAPVVFFVEEEAPPEIAALALSYSFFEVEGQ